VRSDTSGPAAEKPRTGRCGSPSRSQRRRARSVWRKCDSSAIRWFREPRGELGRGCAQFRFEEGGCLDGHAAASDHDDVSAHRKLSAMAAKPLANSPFHQGPDDCRSDASARRDPEPRRPLVSFPARHGHQDERGRVQPDALSGHPLVVTPLAETIAASEALAGARRHFVPVDTESCLRPLARRRLRTARPAFVFIRARNPWVRRLRIRLG